MKRWINEAGGELEKSLTTSTTHFVCDKDFFGDQGALVNQVVEAKKKGQQIDMVNFDWLVESLEKKAKKSEKRHRLAVPVDAADDEPRSVSGMMKQVFLQGAPISEYDQKRVVKEQKHQENMMQEAQAHNMQYFERNTMGLAEQAAVFKRGAQKARRCILSGDWWR